MLLDSPEMPDAIAQSLRDGEPDVVLAYCSGMARFALEAPLDRFPFVFDVVDVDSGKWSDFARVARGPRRWLYRREARHLSAFEAMAARRARAATVVTGREAEALRALSPEARTHVVSNGVDLQYLAPQGAAGERMRRSSSPASSATRRMPTARSGSRSMSGRASASGSPTPG